MILIIDNYDSFVHNLARYFECAGQSIVIIRNDAMDCDEIRALSPLAIVLSPGPCTPDEAGICMDVVRTLGSEIPIFGVCLGHQAIAQAYGWKTIRAPQPQHGKASDILHYGDDLFDDLPSSLRVGRYHSLMIEPQPGAQELEILATFNSAENESIIMALRHPLHPVYGVQFHPESILTEGGDTLISNFITIAQSWHNTKLFKEHAA